MATSTTALSKLCRSNLGILSQKLGLMETMMLKHGKDKAHDYFKMTCPLVKASVGQHFRHSLDHIQLAAKLAANPIDQAELHYDLRERGGTSEHDMSAAEERILEIIALLEVASVKGQQDGLDVGHHSVQACFILSGDNDTEYALPTTGDNETEYALPSTIGRELGFAAHHAIHHMAMVKLIATETIGLSESDLPEGLGRAPSTINFEKQS